ncbi:MAG: four helix bundle protein [Chloroflexota bacterium]|jgi:four helix bundle protein
MSNIRSYRDLEVWQRSVDFAVHLYRLTDAFPPSEDYGLTSQMRRAAVSIASNIAEGHARPGREFARFLGIALGSAAELETQIEIAHRLEYLSQEDYAQVADELDIIGKQLRRLLQRVRK